MTMRRRGKLTVNSQSMISPRVGDDTIELQLTPEQLLGLSQAADLVEPVEPDPISPVISPPPLLLAGRPARHSRLWHLASVAKMAGAMLAYVALAWLGASQLAGKPHALAASALRPTVVVPRPVLITSPSKPTVRVINPFDATEVFEFPAGTSQADDREKVAQILLQRARERHSQWERNKPEVSVRTASLYRPP